VRVHYILRQPAPCRRVRVTIALTLAGASVNVSACGSTTSPALGNTSAAVIVATDTEDVAVVDPRLMRVTGRIGPLSGMKSRGAVSPDHAMLYLLSFDDPSTELVAIDTRALRVQWRVPLQMLEQHALHDTLPVSIGAAMAVTPDGMRLVAQAADAQGEGVAVIDLRSQSVVAFVPLGTVMDVAAEVPSTAMPHGAILVTAVRQTTPAVYSGLFFVLDASTLAVRDSVTITAASSDPTAGMQQVLGAPDGQHAYVVGLQQYRYDLLDRRLTDSVATPSNGRLAITADGSALYRSDAGDFDSPGTGQIFVYGADLTPKASINVTQIAPSPSAGGAPVITGNVIPSADGKLLYVASGTPRAGGFGAFEPARLLVIDPQADVLVESVGVAGSSPLVMFVR